MCTKIKNSALCAKELNETSYHVNHECNYASLAEFITETNIRAFRWNKA